MKVKLDKVKELNRDKMLSNDEFNQLSDQEKEDYFQWNRNYYVKRGTTELTLPLGPHKKSRKLYF